MFKLVIKLVITTTLYNTYMFKLVIKLVITTIEYKLIYIYII